MAEPVSVSVTRDSTGNVVSENVNFSDMANNQFTVVGLPGARYNLSIIGNVETNSISPIAGSVANIYTGALIDTGVQEPQPLETITFTDSLGNTLTLLGSPNTTYDLTLLPYLLAVVSAQDMFLTMQFGDAYLQAKNEFLQRANLA